MGLGVGEGGTTNVTIQNSLVHVHVRSSTQTMSSPPPFVVGDIVSVVEFRRPSKGDKIGAKVSETVVETLAGGVCTSVYEKAQK